MKHLFLVLNLFIWSFVTLGASDDALKRECEQLIKSSDKLASKGQLRMIFEMVGALFNPDKLSQLQVWKIPSRPENEVYQEAKGFGLRNVVIYMGTTRETSNKISKEEAQIRIKEAEETLKEDYGKVVEMSKSRDANACVAKAKELHFSPEAFLEKSRKNEMLFLEKQVDTNERILNLLKDSIGQLDLEWEFIERATLKELTDELRSPDIGNVVIVTHATTNGTLLDSDFNEIPDRAFNNISPTLRSISFFSCHESKVREKYRIEEKFKAQKSIYTERQLYTPAMVNFMGNPDSAPIIGFNGFIKRLESELRRDNDRIYSKTSNKKEQDGCYIELLGHEAQENSIIYTASIKEFRVKSGGYTFSLNGKVVGVLEPDSRESKMNFSCDILNENGSNVIVNQDYKMNPKSVVSGENFKVYLYRPNQEVLVIDGEQFYRKEDKSYRSSKFVFDL